MKIGVGLALMSLGVGLGAIALRGSGPWVLLALLYPDTVAVGKGG